MNKKAPLFTSKLEKKLWISTFLVLLAIYISIGIARPLNSILKDSGLLVPLFILSFIFILLALVLLGLKKRPDISIIGVSIGVFAVYLFVLVRIEIPEERTHIIEYSIFTSLLYLTLIERNRHLNTLTYPSILAILFTILFGSIDECIQFFLPNRVFDLRDILFNSLAAVLAICSLKSLSWARNRS
ncbi:VanZ family protein [Balneola vulgaris]|uniref:VanZ family protein n=1 Tax=Balneola vulgaris TaxID=287535 RepID=UPI00035C21B4